MDYAQLLQDLRTSPSVRLIKSDNAAFTISFLYQEYKKDVQGRRNDIIPYQTLAEHLETYLEKLNAEEPNSYPRRPQEYLRDWLDSGYIREYTDTRSREKVVELTAHTERAIGWLEDLRQRTFVGTESRMLRIFSLLEDIAARSTEDTSLRLKQLERQKAEIDAEIAKIKDTGGTDRFTRTQVRERFLEAETTARQMIGDFREVEDKFRSAAREVYAAQLKPELRRGDVVENVLDATTALRDSDQGRSFYAFWEFLSAPERKEQFQVLLNQVYRLPDLLGIVQPQMTLRRFVWNLGDAAHKVREQNNRLVEQLKRLLDSRTLAETRRVRELINEVKQAAVLRQDNPPEDADFIEVEDKPLIALPMDRDFWLPKEKPVITQQALLEGEATDLDVHQLFNLFYVDESVLQDRIEEQLNVRPTVSLGELLTLYPPEKGIPEVVAYFNIALRDNRHVIERDILEPLDIRRYHDGQEIRIDAPRIIFRRFADGDE